MFATANTEFTRLLSDLLAVQAIQREAVEAIIQREPMEDFNSETDSDYTSYWRDWVSFESLFVGCLRVRTHFCLLDLRALSCKRSCMLWSV